MNLIEVLIEKDTILRLEEKFRNVIRAEKSLSAAYNKTLSSQDIRHVISNEIPNAFNVQVRGYNDKNPASHYKLYVSLSSGNYDYYLITFTLRKVRYKFVWSNLRFVLERKGEVGNATS